MKHALTRIDHPVIAVADMDAGRRTFERLGFMVPPRGSHVEWGTGNWCIMFADDYLELRGILDPAREVHGLDRHLARRGEGLMGIAFGTEGADESFRLMVESGLKPGPVRRLTRNFELPEGWVQPRFALCFPDPADVLGLMNVVVCEHLTPDLIRRPDFLDHPNTAEAILSVTGAAENLDEIETRQRRFLGEGAVHRRDGGLRLAVGPAQHIDLLTPAAFRAAFGAATPRLMPETPWLGAVAIGIADRQRAAALLRANDVAFAAVPSGALRIAPADACGTIIDLAP